MKMKRVTVAVFSLLLLLLFLGYVLPAVFLRDASSEEPLPKPSFSSFSDGDYQTELNEALSDRILFGSFLLRCKTNIELLSGKREINGVYFAEDTLIDKPTLPDDKSCALAAGVINQIAQGVKGKTYALFLPTAAQIEEDKLPAYAPREDEVAVIERLQAHLVPEITVLDSVTPLTSVKNSSFYYHTDPRITSYGAFTIYNYNMKSMGFQPASLNEFNIEYGTRDFYGSLYHRTSYAGVTPDRVDLYHYKTQSFPVHVVETTAHGTRTRDELYDRALLQTDDSINALIGEETLYTQVFAESRGSKKLLVFADENIAPFIQFFILHYGQVDIVDINCLGEVDISLDLSGYDDVLFCFGLESINQTDRFSGLGTVC